jgi:hypothetical protein
MATKPRSFSLGPRITAEERQREHDRQRDKRPLRQLYKTYRWQCERAAFLAETDNQFCVRCKAKGLLNPGTMHKDGTPETSRRRMHLVVNHKIRPRGDTVLFWDHTNWEPLCPDHHDIDVQSEERHQGWGGSKV